MFFGLLRSVGRPFQAARSTRLRASRNISTGVYYLTIYRTLLTRGYFPKELPPAFFTEQFARYATTKGGRAALSAYKPVDNFTECCKFHVPLPGLDRRELRIPHPYSFARLAQLTSKHFSRLLQSASRSGFSKSRPVYATGRTALFNR
jgi:hypothetical protein